MTRHAPDRTAAPLAVLLATYNGARHLSEQLASLQAQTRPPDMLIVGDDGSTDATLDLLRDRTADAPWTTTIHHRPGREKGSGFNFAGLLERVPDDMAYVAFCDQDDVWLPDKIAAGLAALAPMPSDVPALYGARTWEVNEDLTNRRLSRGLGVPSGFRHALVQNYAGGNTMMLNPAGVTLMRTAATRLQAMSVHDWWIYQVVTGCGGEAVFDETPRMLYRQHAGNVIGANTGRTALMARLGRMVDGTYRDWMGANIANLDALRDMLTPDATAKLDDVIALRQMPLPARLRAFAQTGLVRDGRLGQASLWGAVLTGRL